MKLSDPYAVDRDSDPESIRIQRLIKAKAVNGMATIFLNISSRNGTDDKTKNKRGLFV